MYISFYFYSNLQHTLLVSRPLKFEHETFMELVNIISFYFWGTQYTRAIKRHGKRTLSNSRQTCSQRFSFRRLPRLAGGDYQTKKLVWKRSDNFVYFSTKVVHKSIVFVSISVSFYICLCLFTSEELGWREGKHINWSYNRTRHDKL